MKNVLIGCTGSVATIKVPELLQELKANPKISVRLGGYFIHQVSGVLFSHPIRYPFEQIVRIFSQIDYFAVVTEHSKHFLPPLETLGEPGVDVFTDEHEWEQW